MGEVSRVFRGTKDKEEEGEANFKLDRCNASENVAGE